MPKRPGLLPLLVFAVLLLPALARAADEPVATAPIPPPLPAAPAPAATYPVPPKPPAAATTAAPAPKRSAHAAEPKRAKRKLATHHRAPRHARAARHQFVARALPPHPPRSRYYDEIVPVPDSGPSLPPPWYDRGPREFYSFRFW